MFDHDDNQQHDTEQGDSFEDSVQAPVGFAERHWHYEFEVAGRPVEHSGARALPLDTLLTHQETVDLDYALRMVDSAASLYAARRYKHFGVTVVTVGVWIGQPGTGQVRQEHYESDRFLSFYAECNHRALPVLLDAGKKAIDHLADQALAEIIARLRYQEAVRE